MPDYKHDLLFGVGVAPNAREFEEVLNLAELADGLGLDLFGVQDHPYQAAFLDTWTLLAYMAAQVVVKGFRPHVRQRILCFSLFWHALDIVWVGVFTLVYLMGGR